MTQASRILIVEQDADVAKLLSLLLERDGCNVTVVGNPQDALHEAAESAPDVALIERNLGAHDGLELLGALRHVVPAMAGIIMTVDPTIEVRTQAMERGAFDLIVKPFANLKLIAHRVRAALTTSAALRERDQLATKLADQVDTVERLQLQLEQAVERLSSIDPEKLTGIDGTTGISSEHAITTRLRSEASRALRYSRPLTIAVGRIDGLELIFERFGNSATEEAFRGVAALSHAAIREVDAVGRLGISEFVFVFPETNKTEGLQAIERLRSLITQTPVLTAEATGGAPYAVTLSFGLSALPGDSMNADTLLSDAQIALQQARTQGTSQIVAFRARG